MNIHDYMKLNYEVSYKALEDEDGIVYKFEIKDLPGLAVYSDSIEEGLEDLEGAKRVWFETNIELQRKIPLPKEEKEDYSGRVTLRINKSLHKTLVIEAESEGVSLNQYITYLIQKGQTEITKDFFINYIKGLTKSVPFHSYVNNDRGAQIYQYTNAN